MKLALSNVKQRALLELVDDTSPTVRKALLAHFAENPVEARLLLEGIVASKDRMLALHARWFLEELRFTDPVAEFRGFIRSLHYDLEGGALLLSRTVFPRADAGACCTELDAIAARCRELIAEPMTGREKCRVLNRIIFHEYGFHGNSDHYSDPLNSFLNQLIERRKGIPISLSILYILIAHRLGMDLEPVGLPGHFVVGCYTDDDPFFVDVFEQGAFRSANDLFVYLRARGISPSPVDLAPTPVREVLCRCCRNLVHHYTEAGDSERAQLFASFVGEFDATYERHANP